MYASGNWVNIGPGNGLVSEQHIAVVTDFNRIFKDKY